MINTSGESKIYGHIDNDKQEDKGKMCPND